MSAATAPPLTKGDDEDMMKLHEAARKGYPDVIARLITKGVNPNIANKYGCTALHLACKHGHRDVIGVLNMHRVDAVPWHGRYPVHTALLAGNLPVIQELFRGVEIREGNAQSIVNLPDEVPTPTFGDVILKAGTSRLTPLHYACRLRRQDITAFLLDQGGSLQSKDSVGLTPCMHAVDDVDMLGFLLRHPSAVGVSLLTQRDSKESTLLHQALDLGLASTAALVIDLLLADSPAAVSALVLLEDEAKNVPFDTIVQLGETDFLTAILPCIEKNDFINMKFHDQRHVHPERIMWRIPPDAQSQTHLTASADSPSLRQPARKEATVQLLQARLDDIAAAEAEAAAKEKAASPQQQNTGGYYRHKNPYARG